MPDLEIGAQPQTTGYDAANRIVGFTYDARGNVLQDATYAYTWDAYNRLTQVKLVSTGAVVASYAYDSDGMRQTSTVGSTTTRYAVDELTDEIVAILDSAGAVVTSFVRDAAGRLIGMVRGSSVYTYLSNAHGDVTALVDAAGAVVARWTYDAWGKPTEYNAAGAVVPVGTAGNPFLFAGYFFDVATGLYYLRARYYDPKTGRFLSMDPEPGKTTDRLSQNPYIYCQNDPVNLADPTGLRHDAYGGYGDNPTGAQQAAANKAANDARKRQEEAARARQRAAAEADRKARAAMDTARQQQGAETRVRNQMYESVRTGDYAWFLAANGEEWKNGVASAAADKILASPGYQQWLRGQQEVWARQPRVDLSAGAYAQYLVEVEGMGMAEAYQQAWEVYESGDLGAIGHGVCALREARRGMSADDRAAADLAFSRGWSAEWQKEGERLDTQAGVLSGQSLAASSASVLFALGAAATIGVPVIAGGLAAASLVTGAAGMVSTGLYNYVTDVRVERGHISGNDPRNGSFGDFTSGVSLATDGMGIAATFAKATPAVGFVLAIPAWGVDFCTFGYEVFNY